MLALTPEDLTAVMRAGLVKSNRTVAMIVNPPADGETKGGR